MINVRPVVPGWPWRGYLKDGVLTLFTTPDGGRCA